MTRSSALFQRGTKDALLTTVDASYGYLVFEGYAPVEVLHLAGGKVTLKEAVDLEVISGDQAGELERAMTQAGLLPDEAALYKAIAGFAVPAEFTPRHTFKVCDKCTAFPPELPHGVTVDHEGDRVAQISTLAEGFQACRTAVVNAVGVLDAVTCFKAMVAANLPANNDETQARWAALSEDMRRKFRRARSVGQASIVDIPGMGSAIMLDLTLPRELVEGLLGLRSGRTEPNKGKGRERE